MIDEQHLGTFILPSVSRNLGGCLPLSSFVDTPVQYLSSNCSVLISRQVS